MHLDGSLQLKVHFYKMYGTHIHKTGYSVVENYSSVRKWPIVAKKKNVAVCEQVRLQYIGRKSLKNSSTNSEKVLVVSGYFLAVCKSTFFALRLEMHVRCNNQYKTGADRGNILEQPRLFECMGICVLSPAHESDMRGYLVYVIVKKRIAAILFTLNHSI